MSAVTSKTITKALKSAILILSARGLARQMNQDPHTGAVDVLGAFMFACGAPRLSVLVANASEVVPAANLATFDAIIDLLDTASPGGSVVEWTDDPETTLSEVLEFLEVLTREITSSCSGSPLGISRTLRPSIHSIRDTLPQ